MSYLAKAIWKLCPDSEFSFIEDDYSTIQWDKLDGDAPTSAQIDNAIKQIKAEEEQEIASKATKKATASAKLEALGLTADDLKALGL